MFQKNLDKTLISIIIPAYNSVDFLNRALKSIFLKYIDNIEVIVVDNGSIDNTADLVNKHYPDVIFLHNKENRGACFARNQGISLAKGSYVMIMDSDTELEVNFLHKLSNILDNFSQNIASFSPKIINAKTEKLFSCGLRISSIFRVHDIGKSKDPEEYEKTFDIDGPNSCCAVFNRKYLDKVKEKNYYDEDFFFLFEDVDLALRLKQKKLKSVYLPEIVCYHHENSSNTPRSKRKYLCFRNRLFMILKKKSLKAIILFFLKSFFYDFFRTVYFFFTNKYAFFIFNDLRNKYKNEKNNNF